MKKLGIILLAVFMLLAVSCERQVQIAELALVTDYGTIDDASFNQGSWEGLLRFALEHDITHRYIQPADESTADYLAAIDLAVRGGARIVVTPGFLFETAVFMAQDRHRDVSLVSVDGVPNDGNSDMDERVFRINDNVVGILYAEDQAGFLAGYAAVRDGFRSLGFMGGMAVPAVIRFGYGFVQGAEYAAQVLGLAPDSVTIQYHYTGTFSASPAIQTMAASWFQGGVEVIFACGGAIGNSIMAAAEAHGGWVIGVDVDQSHLSHTVITSAMKNLQGSVYDSIAAWYAGEFPGGQIKIFDAANDGIGLPMATSRFRTFSQADYDAIFERLASGEIPRVLNVDGTVSPSVVPVSIVNVIEL